MKTMVEAMLLLKQVSQSWQGHLIGTFVADEEVGSTGSISYAQSNPPVDRVIRAHDVNAIFR